MATDSMTVKITPNDRGNPMTSTEHRRFSDQEIAQAATSKRSTGSPALAQPAFERHYRIGELAETWQLGRETVRLLVKDEPGSSSGFALDAKRPIRTIQCPNRWQYESTLACLAVGRRTAARWFFCASRSTFYADPALPSLESHQLWLVAEG